MANASFRHFAPASRIFYGDDCLKHLPAELARFGATRAVVFCGRTLARATPGLSTIQAALGPLCAGVFAGVVEQSPLAAVEDRRRRTSPPECGRGHRAGWRVGRRDRASGDSALRGGENRSRSVHRVHPWPASGEPQAGETEAAAVCRPNHSDHGLRQEWSRGGASRWPAVEPVRSQGAGPGDISPAATVRGHAQQAGHRREHGRVRAGDPGVGIGPAGAARRRLLAARRQADSTFP